MPVIETARGAVEIRELSSVTDMVAAEQIQLQVWGADVIPHPKEILIPIQHEGGLLAGAFATNNEMVGLIFGFPAKDSGVMHSQMLATLEAWRGQGLGSQMKWFQRQWCLDHGYTQVRWTVDPLRVANAELNIRNLGGTACTYFLDYYGPMQGIDAGAPTDRLLLEWPLLNQRVADRAVRKPEDRGFPQAEPANNVVDGAPADARLDLTGKQILIRLPENFVQLSKTNSQLALDWRLQTRGLLVHYFSRGYQITEFTRIGGPAYLLEMAIPE